MSLLGWLFTSSALMAVIALGGIFMLAAGERMARRLLLPLVAIAAGSLIGSAFLHMIPAALEPHGVQRSVWLLVLAGFTGSYALEQLVHWHHHGHDHGHEHHSRPFVYLILVGDALHNLIDGLAIAGAFLVDVQLGLTTLFAAAAHEVPREIGDVAVLMHGGWSVRRALTFNVATSVVFLLGALLAYALRGSLNVSYLVALAAGNFIYLGATDLVPEISKPGNLRANLLHFGMFLIGLGAMYLAALAE